MMNVANVYQSLNGYILPLNAAGMMKSHGKVTAKHPSTSSARPKFELGSVTSLVEQGTSIDLVRILETEGLTTDEVSALVFPNHALRKYQESCLPLSNEESARALRVAKILLLASQVFANREKALSWLRRSNHRLGSQAPIELLRTGGQEDLIEQMLAQIDEGIFI